MRRPLGLLWVPVVLALWFPFACIAIGVLRLAYPFELEWIEGAVLDTVYRVLAGQSVYPRPSLEFIALNYTPLYYHVGAWAARLIGPGFMALRLVSLLATLGTFVVLFECVRRVTANKLAGVLAVCLYAATYRLSGTWFDVARADSLYLLLLLLALAVLHFDPRPPRARPWCRHRSTTGGSTSWSRRLRSLVWLPRQSLSHHWRQRWCWTLSCCSIHMPLAATR
jgi:hypothetical protein